MQISANKPIIMPQPAAPARRAPAPTSIFTSAPAEDRVSLNPSPGQAAPAADGPRQSA